MLLELLYHTDTVGERKYLSGTPMKQRRNLCSCADKASETRVNALLHQVQDVMLPGVVNDFDAHSLSGDRLVDMLMLIFQRAHCLRKVRAVSFDMDGAAGPERSLVQLDHGNAEMAVVVRHDADGLLLPDRLFDGRDAA